MDKRCSCCHELKAFSYFHSGGANRDGYFSECKECTRRRNRDSYQKDPRVGMLRSAKYRASKSGTPFNLGLEDIVVPDFCPVLGIRIFFTYGSRATRDTQPSLDRIIPEKGYVKGNVIVVSFRANRIKSNATADEILAVGNFYKDLK